MNRNAPMNIDVISSGNANSDGSLCPRCLYDFISVAMKKYFGTIIQAKSL
jgi:hypothetical protein